MQNEFQLISHDSLSDLNQELITEKESNFNLLNILEGEKEYSMRLCRELIAEKNTSEHLRKSLYKEKQLNANLSLEMEHLESIYSDLLNENKLLKSQMAQETLSDLNKKLKNGLNYGQDLMIKLSKAYSCFKFVQQELEYLEGSRDFKP